MSTNRTLAAYAGDLLAMTVDTVRVRRREIVDPIFCAICTRVAGPFKWRPFGRGDAPVRVCLSCVGADVPEEADEPDEKPPIVRVDAELVTPIEQRIKVGTRRQQLRRANRCINGPLEDRPGKRLGVIHGQPVRGGKCQRCIDACRGAR